MIFFGFSNQFGIFGKIVSLVKEKFAKRGTLKKIYFI